jgi:hypothetical protein
MTQAMDSDYFRNTWGISALIQQPDIGRLTERSIASGTTGCGVDRLFYSPLKSKREQGQNFSILKLEAHPS